VLLGFRRSIPHPPCFAKRVRKPLKTNEGGAKKRGKREQEAANHLWQRTSGNDLTQRALRAEAHQPDGQAQSTQREKIGGNADRCEKKGVEQKGVQKWMKTKE
jgi:hypothetical protein